MLNKILLIFLLLFVFVIVVALVISLIVGFVAFWTAVGTAIYYMFKKDKTDKKKNKNFKIKQGKEIK